MSQVRDLAILLTARFYLYSLFQSIFAKEPCMEHFLAHSRTITEKSLEAAFVSNAAACEPLTRFIEVFSKPRDAKDVAQLCSEYTRLFIGPGEPKAPPWESMYASKEPRLFGNVTSSVRKAYKAQGRAPELYPRVADDHVALELDFLRVLAKQDLLDSTGIATIPSKSLASSNMQASREFLNDHLGRWIEDFAERVRDADESPDGYYACCSQALAVFIKNDEELFGKTLVLE